MKCKRDEIVVLTVSWEISESFQEDFTIKSLLDRNWIFVVYAVIRLPLTQSSEIYTDTHTSAEISQEFPLFYFGTKTVHIDFVAAEILSSPLCSVCDEIISEGKQAGEQIVSCCLWTDCRLGSSKFLHVLCLFIDNFVGQPVEAGVSMLQVLACCSAKVGRRWTHNIKRQSETCPEDYTITATETGVGMYVFVCLCNWLAPSS